MKFVIVGYGRVGSRTVRVLLEEGHDVTVVERDADRVRRARADGVTVVEGDGASEAALEEAGVAAADAIAGLTSDLNVNFAACMVGKHHGCRTVMRIDEDYREEIYRTYADDVDDIVYPEQLGAASAKTALLGGDFNVIADLTEQLALSTIDVPEGSPAVGQRVNSIGFDGDARIYAHGRADEPMTIPLPGTVVDPGDRVAIIAERDALDGVRETLLGAAG